MLQDDELANKAKAESEITLTSAQELIREMFGAKDASRGIDGTFMWFMEEVGELAAADVGGGAAAAPFPPPARGVGGPEQARHGARKEALQGRETGAHDAGVDLSGAEAGQRAIVVLGVQALGHGDQGLEADGGEQARQAGEDEHAHEHDLLLALQVQVFDPRLCPILNTNLCSRRSRPKRPL